jgi:hypothetical protein
MRYFWGTLIKQAIPLQRESESAEFKQSFIRAKYSFPTNFRKPLAIPLLLVSFFYIIFHTNFASLIQAVLLFFHGFEIQLDISALFSYIYVPEFSKNRKCVTTNDKKSVSTVFIFFSREHDNIHILSDTCPVC